MTTETVTIKDRQFRLGAWYRGRHGRRPPHQLVAFKEDGRCGRPGGDVKVWASPGANNGYGYVWSGDYWAQWAGEEIET